MKIVKRILQVVLLLVLVVALLVGGYVAYMVIQFNRIPDFTPLDIENPVQTQVQPNVEYSAATFNIGFGAYNHDFSFFMDKGTMLDGTQMQGKYGKAQSEEIVKEDTTGAIQQVQALNPDFYLFQEVDKKANRSWKVDQAAQIKTTFPEYSYVYASNFHSAYLAYPLHDMHGAVEAGLVTLSRYDMKYATRRSFPVDESFPTKFFDLDRCFTVQRLPVEGGQELVLINLHMSAYDEGGKIREQQLQMLNEVMVEEQQKGNWVVIGGDFNHALSGTLNVFPTQQKQQEGVYDFPVENLPAGFRVVDAANAQQVATCRGSDIPYQPGVNYSVVIDGFIVSDNVEASAENIDADFLYSDHNPVLLRFKLIAPEEPQAEETQEQPAEE